MIVSKTHEPSIKDTALGHVVLSTPAPATRRSSLDLLLKRASDILVAFFGLLFVVPLFGAIALAIRCESEGPTFFRQKRVGRYGVEFYILKFRTMCWDPSETGPQVTAADDHRVTRIGKFLRATKLVELPQLINVLLGDMSFVGPRPQVPRFVEHFTPELKDTILSATPGLTSPATIAFRNEERMLRGQQDREAFYVNVILPIKCTIDAEYVAVRSIWHDGGVLITTAWIVGRTIIKRWVATATGSKTENRVSRMELVVQNAAINPESTPLKLI